MEHLYQQERTANSSLRREVSFYQKLQTEAELAKEEAKLLRKKLKDLENVANVIKGCNAIFAFCTGSKVDIKFQVGNSE